MSCITKPSYDVVDDRAERIDKKVRNRALMLVAMWADSEDFARDPTLGIMEERYESLKTKCTTLPCADPGFR